MIWFKPLEMCASCAKLEACLEKTQDGEEDFLMIVNHWLLCSHDNKT